VGANEIAQVLGAFATVGYILMIQQKSRLRYMVILTAAGLFDLIQYYFVGNYASVVTLIGGQVFLYIVIFCILKKVSVPKWVIVIYLSYLLISGIWAWGGIFPFLACLANMQIAVFQGLGNMRYIRIGTLIVALAWLANGLWSGSYTVCIGYAFEAVSAAVAMWRFRGQRTTNK